MEYTFDQVADLLDEMAETFPPVFFEQLNGGILLQEEAKPDPMFPEARSTSWGIRSGQLPGPIY